MKTVHSWCKSTAAATALAMLTLVSVAVGLSAPFELIDDDNIPNDLKPAPGGSFPWEKAVVLPALFDRNAPLPEPGGRFGTTPTRETKSKGR